MLERLESERRESGRRAVAAQEEERRRIARELHDEVGPGAHRRDARARRPARRARPCRHEPGGRAPDRARAAARDARRPGAPERAARPLHDRGGPRRACASSGGSKLADVELRPEVELVVYRVAQESLTNVMRHAGRLARCWWRSSSVDGALRLIVRDNGRGCRTRATARARHRRHARAGPARGRPAGRSRRAGRRDRGAAGRPAARRRRSERSARRRGSCSPTTTRWSAAGCGWCSTPSPTWRWWPRPATAPRPSSTALADDVDLAVLDVAMPRLTGLQAAAELQAPPARAAHADAVDVRQRAVLLRGAQGGRVGLRAQERGRPGPGRGVPGGDARRAVPLPGGRRGADPRLPRPGRPRRGRCRPIRSRRASWRSSSWWPRATRATRSPTTLVISEEDRRAPPQPHPREARDARPGGADALRDPARPGRAVELLRGGVHQDRVPAAPERPHGVAAACRSRGTRRARRRASPAR